MWQWADCYFLTTASFVFLVTWDCSININKILYGLTLTPLVSSFTWLFSVLFLMVGCTQDRGVPSSLEYQTLVFSFCSLWLTSFPSFPFLYITFWNVQLSSVLGGWVHGRVPSKLGYQIVLGFVVFKCASQVPVLRKSHLLWPFLLHMVQMLQRE